MGTWQEKHIAVASGSADDDDEAPAYRKANAEMIWRTLLGHGPDARADSVTRLRLEAGMRCVFNMSAAHVPALLATGGSYLNCYDLQKLYPERRISRLRSEIDAVVAQVDAASTVPETLYYGAVELNGSGMRYYGDLCVVLKPDEADDALLLLTNSYDLHRDPTRAKVYSPSDPKLTRSRRAQELQGWAGRWPADAADMAVWKLLRSAPATQTRLTAGVISQGVLNDETYMEIVRGSSFSAGEVEEIRTGAADAGADARIGDRTSNGPSPPLAHMLWRQRRRGAERAATACGLAVRVVVSPGRER